MELIAGSELFRAYASAFHDATGVSLHLATAEGEILGGDGAAHRNTFCGMLDARAPACEGCFETWRKMAAFDEGGVHHFTCFAGLCKSCVPIRTGARTVGLLVAREVATHRMTTAKFDRILARLQHDGRDIDEARLRHAYFSTPTIPRKTHEAFIRLLEFFAAHLALIANQLAIHEKESPDPAIRRAREFIHAHLTEPIALKTAARRACLSTCYFSTKFKQSTGLAFTEYVAAARVEQARKLLADPSMRVSEIAYEVGFQSLTHFNRVFKATTGLSPTRFREAAGGGRRISKNPATDAKNPVSHPRHSGRS
jgi:AraC-like DNA-binding protein